MKAVLQAIRRIATVAVFLVFAACSPHLNGLPGNVQNPPVDEHRLGENGVTRNSATSPENHPTEPSNTETAEQPLEPLEFRPDLLLLLGQYQKIAPAAQLYGYHIESGKLGQLTSGGTGHAWPVIPSSDGAVLAYFRQKPNQLAGGPDAICTRPSNGGSPVCLADDWQDRAAWRAGTRELSLSRVSGGAGVFSVGPDGFTPTGGQEAYSSFSPDGQWGVTWSDGLWLTAVDHPSVKHQLLKERGTVTWLTSDTLVVVVSPDYRSADRDGGVYMARVDGTVTLISEPKVDSVSGVMIDPKGRYLAANYGIPGATWRHSGAALYDLASGRWSHLPFTGAEFAIAWVANGDYLLVEETDGTRVLYDPVGGGKTPLPDAVQHAAFQGRSDDGNWVAFLDEDKHQLVLYGVLTGEVRPVEVGEQQVLGVKWVPNGP